MARYPFPFLQTLEDLGDQYLLKRAPSIPDQVREVIALIVPWLVIIGVVFSVPLFASFLGIGWFGSVSGFSYSFINVISTVLGMVTVVLQACGIPGLLRRDRVGWQWLFAAGIVSLISVPFAVSPFFSLIGVSIGLYLLFQIKPLFR